MSKETKQSLRGRKPNGATGGTLADPAMLDKIDRLFACNVGDYIFLPQIVVVGDQSSGKSSVLEGVTNLPFPRDSGLCTRFATQITFRRSPLTGITISIIPAKNSTSEHANQVREWAKRDLDGLDQKAFTHIMLEVHTVMGLSKQDNSMSSPTFSDDVLCIEVCGPDQEHLSVIDVPGIFRQRTQGLTSTADMSMVKSMVRAYMANPRSVMLTVIPANVDLATQEILEMAEEVDPDGQRTLGVLTKPDLVDKGAEQAVVDLVEGRRHQLALGWSLVRNPGQQQLTDPATNRQALEQEFFSRESPWDSLNKEKVGIPALQVRLQEILAEHIRREFPKKLRDCKALLVDLGAKRDTPTDQSKYLIDIATRFQETVTSALNSHYSGNDIFDQQPSLRLVTTLVARNETFSNSVQTWGNTYCFKEPNLHDFGSMLEPPPVEEEPYDAECPPPVSVLDTRLHKTHDDVRDIVRENEMLSLPRNNDVLKWLTTVYRDSRGLELGTFNSSLLALTMKEQSKKWDSIAFGYISEVVTVTHTFVTDFLCHTCSDERVRTGLASILMDGLLERYRKAFAHVEFILQERMQKAMLAISIDNCKHGAVVPLRAITQTHYHMSNAEHIVQDLHDILQSYYKVARKRIVDVICMQAADYYLISGPDTPLKLFSPVFVGAMTPEQLDEVSGEDARQKRRRKQLQKEIEDLERGRKILT
ncbi:hypothetical protein HYALB_00011764 [Hymenoscyphus albidus]|uniref:Uncharacterized protein n=1 Tax=Hymenoscyphus albidus TaxID=595503 RepID=A0A9N9LJF5_9HELO|nr:hypothetical protein HYALB_00011764 [Hymenoscyphus albidus]